MNKIKRLENIFYELDVLDIDYNLSFRNLNGYFYIKNPVLRIIESEAYLMDLSRVKFDKMGKWL